MYHDYLILGGAGLVGLQVCRHIVHQLQPKRIVVASLFLDEAQKACKQLEKEFGDKIAFVPESGNLFVPTDLSTTSRTDLLSSSNTRRRLLKSLYDEFELSYQENHLVHLIKRHRPEVIVDCVNTATGLSYQDVFDGAAKVREWIQDDNFDSKGVPDLETLLLSQTTPQLIRHVRFVHRATTEYQTRLYLKVGTTGTGGMGLNIPYTHSEDKPSKKLLAKNEAAFGHTGLLFLLARTPNAPIVKEVKPAAMIGYRGVRVQRVQDKHRNTQLFAPKKQQLSNKELNLSEGDTDYKPLRQFDVPVVDTGENGVFTRGEFAAITALGQMEYITPEEIAKTIVLEIRGSNTGQDVLSSMDASVLNPSYKAGLLRGAALTDLDLAEQASSIPSVALGRLGPPELSKLLFEAHLFKQAYNAIESAAANRKPLEVCEALVEVLERSGVSETAPSIGIPIVMPDGKTILRGPRINVPELVGHKKTVSMADPKEVEKWIRKGWIDLRPKNISIWQKRFQKMLFARAQLRDMGSASASIYTFIGDSFEIGEVVAWIFNNEMDGYRMK
jgi:hypothetical protein